MPCMRLQMRPTGCGAFYVSPEIISGSFKIGDGPDLPALDVALKITCIRPVPNFKKITRCIPPRLFPAEVLCRIERNR
jgi:hypothetical protein